MGLRPRLYRRGESHRIRGALCRCTVAGSSAANESVGVFDRGRSLQMPFVVETKLSAGNALRGTGEENQRGSLRPIRGKHHLSERLGTSAGRSHYVGGVGRG